MMLLIRPLACLVMLFVAPASCRQIAGAAVDKALEAISRNDVRAAERELEALSKADPQNREAALARGVYLFQLGKFAQARAVLEPLASDARAETIVLLARAATGECAGAAKSLESKFEATTDPRLRRLAGLGAAQCAVTA